MKKNTFISFIITISVFILSCNSDDTEENLLPENDNLSSPLKINKEQQNTVIDPSPISLAETERLLGLNDTDLSNQILILINNHRKEKQLTELSLNSTATIEALKHSDFQMKQNSIGHDNASERANSIFSIENATRYGENVAFGFKTAKPLVDAWLSSPGHRNNIEGDFTKTGIGVIKNNNGVPFYTNVFFK